MKGKTLVKSSETSLIISDRSIFFTDSHDSLQILEGNGSFSFALVTM